MAWSWSHSPDAYRAAEHNLSRLSLTELKTIAREWMYHDRKARGAIRHRPGAKRPAGFRLPSFLARASREVLIAWIWERMESHQMCDNGGWNAYACPYGCHTVPFDTETEGEA